MKRERKRKIEVKIMWASFSDSVDQLGGDSFAAPTHLSGCGHAVDESPFADYSSVTPIDVSGGGLSPDHPELSSLYSAGENETPFEGENVAPESDGPLLFPLLEMQPEEGAARREWRRQNALRLEEKEKIEKELLNHIIDEAYEYKINFHSKRKITCENNKATNREREKVYMVGRDKFHAEADKSYWKSIAELIPNEVPVIEKRGGKKDQVKRPSVFVIQGPKPGKPTQVSRMRQILIKLKHNTLLHLKHSPPPPPPLETDAATAPPAAVTSCAEAVAVA